MLAPFGESILVKAEPAVAMSVIDVGCGAGSTSIEIASQVGTDGAVLSVDVEPRFVQTTEERAARLGLANLTGRVADAASAPLGPCDLVVSRFALMLFPDHAAGMNNIFRMLRPRGRLVATVWQDGDANEWSSLPLTVVSKQLGFALPPPSASGPFAMSDPVRTALVLDNAGFVDVSIQSLEFPLWVGADPLDAIEFFDADAGGLRQQLPPAVAEDLTNALARALLPFTTAAGVMMPSAAWLISATRPA